MTCENTKAADTNATSLAVTKDAMPATADTKWVYQQPNEISSFSATIEKTARDPISRDRQRRKGSITTLAAAPAFTSDLTLEMVSYYMPSFLFTIWKGLQPESYTVVDAVATGSTYNVETGDAILTDGTLIHVSGFINPENNGIKTVASGTATTVVVNEMLIDETADAEVRMYVVGVRGASGDLQIDAEQNLISTTLDFTTLGLAEGQFFHLGGSDTANQFANASGKARIAQIEANRLVLEARDEAYTADTGAGKEVDLFFSAFARNVPVGDVDFNKQFFHMEATYNTDPTLYEYGDCCLNNTLAINNALQDKATMDLGFVGKDVTVPSDTPRIGTRVNQLETEPFNTTSDIVRLRLADTDDTGVSTFFKDTNISINNNVAAEYVLGQLEAEFMNFGNFEVDIETSVVFTDAVVLSAIRNNTTLGLSMAYKNGDGGFVLDMPCGTFSDGSKNLARNEKIKLNSPFMVHKDEERGYSMSVSLFWYLP